MIEWLEDGGGNWISAKPIRRFVVRNIAVDPDKFSLIDSDLAAGKEHYNSYDTVQAAKDAAELILMIEERYARGE